MVQLQIRLGAKLAGVSFPSFFSVFSFAFFLSFLTPLPFALLPSLAFSYLSSPNPVRGWRAPIMVRDKDTWLPKYFETSSRKRSDGNDFGSLIIPTIYRLMLSNVQLS